MKQPLQRFSLLLWLSALLAGPAWSQCASTYTGTGSTATTAGGTAGLVGQYYNGAFHTQTGFNEANPLTFFSGAASVTRRIEPTVDFANEGFGSVNGNAAGTIAANFSARYRGSVTLKTGGTYTFYLTSDDASYMFLGKEAAQVSPTPNNAFIKNGGNHGNIEVRNTIAVAATGPVDIQVLLGQGGGGVTIKLEYSGGPDNLARQVVPQTAVCAGPSGLTYAVNQAPVADNATNATIISDNGSTTVLNPNLSGFDIDGSVASYQITTLPTAGTLKNGATVISAANIPYSIPAANIGNLTYTVLDGVGGTFSFQYRSVDNTGALSTAATYMLPVTSNRADLATTLTASTTLGGAVISEAAQGSLLFYTATTTNNGPVAATNVTTTIYLPAGLTGISLSNSGVYNSANGQATFPAYDVAAGASVSRNIAFSMPGTTVNATASAVSSAQVDPNSNNNVGSNFTNPTQVADVSVAINGPTRVLANQAVVYSVVPTNIGPSTATGVTLQAKLATGLAGVVASGPNAPGSGSYNATTGVVTWPLINSLANGVSLVYTVRFNSPTTTGGTITASGSATSTTANGDPVAVNNDGTAAQSIITTQVVPQAATLLCVVPGADGNATPLANGFNTYFPGVGTVAAGATSITLGTRNTDGAANPIVAGDLLLIMQMQGGDIDPANTDAYGNGINGDNLAAGVILNSSFTAGVYEYAIAGNSVAATGGALTITQGLSFNYTSAAATATSGQKRFQVIRVPRYNNVTLTSNVTAPRWNGVTGGVMAMDVNGTLNMGGFKLDMAGRGFRGGAGQQLGGAGGVAQTDYRNSTTLNTSSNKGEGTTGTPRFLNDAGTRLDTQVSGLLPAGLSDGYPSGDRGRGAPGNAGGGATDGRPSANDQNAGGGGGANAGRGGVGGNGWDSNSSTGGYGGAGFTQATASRIIMGGGGGAGTTNNGTVNNDTNAYPANAGIAADGFASSGAAGGGVVIIRATTVSANAGTIDVSGSSMQYVPNNDASGGAGAGGSVVLLCNASNGNANSTILQNITVLANGGLGGSNTGGGSPHGPGGGGAGGVAFTSSPTNAASSLQPGANGTTFGFTTYGSGVASASLGQGLSSITRADVPNVVVGCPADVVTTITSSATSTTPGTTVTFTANTINNGAGTANNVRETITLAPNLATVQPNGQLVPTATNTFTGVQTFADGTTYNPATGVVTFPAVASLAFNATLKNATTNLANRVSFVMPTQNVLGTAASTSSGDLDPRLANNDGSLPAANVKVTAINNISGTVFDDVNYGGGRGRSLAAASTSAVATGFPSGTIGSAGTRVELYNSSNVFVAATTTGADGSYGFSGISVGTYTVRVVNSTVKSARDPDAINVLPVQTFRTNNGVADTERVGGEDPTKVDGPANFSSVTLKLQGLNLSGGDNTAFIDQVQILDANDVVVATALSNGSFETPNVGSGFQYTPTGGVWDFFAGAGIAGNGSGFAPPAAPNGTQAAFIQGAGSSASQALNLTPGTYRVRFSTAQRNQSGQTNDQTLAVQINGSEIGRVQPANNGAYTTYTSGTFTVGALGGGTVAQSIAPVTLGAAGVTGVDFGFNFDAIVNINDTGQGSLRQFILNANALPNGNLNQELSSNGGTANPVAGVETSIFMISNGATQQGLRTGLTNQLSGAGVAIIKPNTATNGALPAFTDANTSLDGTTQTLNITNTNNAPLGTGGAVGTGTGAGTISTLNGPEVQIQGTPAQANSDYGITLAASSLTVKGVAVLGFGNTGSTTTGNPNGANIYVTGAATTGTLITGNVIGTPATVFPQTATDASITTATRSPGNGILLANFTANTTVSATISNNLIGFNGASGIEALSNSTTNSLLITGNEIRRNAQLSLTADGVHLGTAGGTVQNNIIRANLGTGVDLAGSAGGALITGNNITANGQTYAENSGVRAFGQGNTVQFNNLLDNLGNGVLVRSGTNAANVEGTTFITQNAIATNGKLGIDLLANGDSETAGTVTINDSGDSDGGSNSTSAVGGNGLLNFPILLQARINGTNLLVRGFSRPGAKIELFTAGTADASGFGEGAAYKITFTEGNTNLANGPVDTNTQTGTYFGLVNGLSQGTDNTNYFEVSIPLASLSGTAVAVNNVLTSTATLAGIGTSEFSGVVTVASGPLPVELTEFAAKAVGTDAKLTWRTASEKNNDHFDVERSFTGSDFARIGTVQGQGTTSAATDYAWTDANVAARAAGPVYYRLKQVDADGTASFSPVRTVAFTKEAVAAVPAISVFPNPATAATKLDLTLLPAGSYQVSLLDATGRVVLRATRAAGLAETLDLNSIASGTYTVLVRGQHNGQVVNLTTRLVKE